MDATIGDWARAALIRAVKTAAQTLVGLMGTGAASITDFNWTQMLGIAAATAIASLLTSVAGVPEVGGGASALRIAGEVSDDGR